jgi:hypothetical protein
VYGCHGISRQHYRVRILRLISNQSNRTIHISIDILISIFWSLLQRMRTPRFVALCPLSISTAVWSVISLNISWHRLYCTVTQGALVFSRAQYLVLISYTNWFTVVTVVISSPFHRLCWLYLSIRIHEELRDNIIANCSKFGAEFHSLVGIGFRFKLSDWSLIGINRHRVLEAATCPRIPHPAG